MLLLVLSFVIRERQIAVKSKIIYLLYKSVEPLGSWFFFAHLLNGYSNDSSGWITEIHVRNLDWVPSMLFFPPLFSSTCQTHIPHRTPHTHTGRQGKWMGIRTFVPSSLEGLMRSWGKELRRMAGIFSVINNRHFIVMSGWTLPSYQILTLSLDLVRHFRWSSTLHLDEVGLKGSYSEIRRF